MAPVLGGQIVAIDAEGIATVIESAAMNTRLDPGVNLGVGAAGVDKLEGNNVHTHHHDEGV